MDRISFTVNGEKCFVGPDVDSDVALLDYLREYLELRGTKYMCKEAGCGACIVTVTARDPYNGQRRTFAINSCMVSVLQCADWKVTTIEGLGDRRRGYHPLQKALAENNGTQCGHCSPGWVMSMHGLLESRHYNLTQYEIEDSLGSNVCRCTGYRPILEAFKSFATDAPKPNVVDIEDLKVCKGRDSKCETQCIHHDWCFVDKEDVIPAGFKKIHLKDDRLWFIVTEIAQIFDILNTEGYDSYMLVGGNTGRGVLPIFSFPKILIDINGILDLKRYFLEQNLVVGTGTTLTDLLSIFEKFSKQFDEFKYLEKLYEHVKLVAHIPVRNIGTIAGNLMLKHRKPTFDSDIFLLFETVNVIMTIVDRFGFILEVTPQDFLRIDMTGRVITYVKFPPLSEHYKFVSHKIMPRSQNAHAQVNAAFLYHFDHNDTEKVLSARIVITGLSAEFVHANKTEEYLVGKKIFTNEVLQKALKILDRELVVEEIAGEMKPEFRKKLALGLFYKTQLTLIPIGRLKVKFRSARKDLRKSRPVSKATQVYDTNPIVWPISEPIPKVEALIQCAGELKYCNDLVKQPREVFAAFVTADVARGEIESIDPEPALKLAGVLAFFSAKDIPGRNTFASRKVSLIEVEEEVFCQGTVKYYDQAIGVMVAESEKLANRAALLVQIKYKIVKEPPILTIKDVRTRDPDRISVFFVFPARDRGTDVTKIISGDENIFSQYPFTMETIACVSRPNDDGIEVFPTTQWVDATQVAIADALVIADNRVYTRGGPLGGGYGIKMTRASHMAVACSLVTYLMNRPCRLVLTIQANMRIVGRRLPCTLAYETGVNESGEIQYLEYHFYEDNGYVVSDAVATLALSNLKNCYDNRRWQYKVFNVTTDTPSNTFIRSPGSLEAIAMTEYIMERISYEINRDPLEVRMNNLNREDPAVRVVIENLIRDSNYHERKKEVQKFNELNRWKKRGFRIAISSWSSTVFSDYSVLLSVHHGDGSVSIRHGGCEMGQGTNTRVVQIVAYTLNISKDKVKVKANDSVSNPNTFLAGGSRSTHSVVFGAIKCCQLLLDRLAPVREIIKDSNWEAVVQYAYNQGMNLQTSFHTSSNDQFGYRVAGAAAVEVELDILTGEHDIVRVDLVQDPGASINPELDLGQIEGAFVMGIGYWTHEHLIFDQKTGELLTDRTWYYHVPLAKDIPVDFRVKLLRNFNERGTLGSRSVGEPPMTTAIAVGFAIREAIAASREESGYPRTEWFTVEGPYTLEQIILSADTKLEEFLYY